MQEERDGVKGYSNLSRPACGDMGDCRRRPRQFSRHPGVGPIGVVLHVHADDGLATHARHVGAEARGSCIVMPW